MRSGGKLCLIGVGAFALALFAAPARAADPVFPLGSRVGLVPPAGMIPSRAFAGFADPNEDAAILIMTLPAATYTQAEKMLDPVTLRKQGISLAKREGIKLGSGQGLLLFGRQLADKARYRKWLLLARADSLTVLVNVQIPEQDHTYSNGVVRAALTTLSVRSQVPQEEKLALLPFTVADLAGFHVEDVIGRHALFLGDAPSGRAEDANKAEATERRLQAHLLVAAIPGGPAEPQDRANFARLAFNEIGGIREIHVMVSEPLRIGGQPGYQTMAQAKDVRSGTDLMVVQWLRFGSGGLLRMVGIASAENWTSVLSRLRAVRDSVEPR